VIEVLDLALALLLKYKWNARNSTSQKKTVASDALYCVVLFAVIINWLLIARADISFEYLVPIRALLLVGDP